MITRRKTKKIKCGNLFIGGDAPIWIQSMTNTYTSNIDNTVNQIHRLQDEGCEIVRVAVPDIEAAQAIKVIKSQIDIPIVADIHFDYRLALESLKSGVDKLRLNPGNIGSDSKVKEVVEAAKSCGVPIRIGVNGGSLDKTLLSKYGGVTADGLVESALSHIHLLEKQNFDDIIISLKASDIHLTLEAYNKMADRVDYPLHIGITESGSVKRGTVKSSVGIGALLLAGLGDTLRVSLTGDPVNEVPVAKHILSSLGIRQFGVEIISCPTCGRCRVALDDLVSDLEAKVKGLDKNLVVAVMGCAVNGPGEAREADLGVASGNGMGLIFKKGEIIKRVEESEIVEALYREIIAYE